MCKINWEERTFEIAKTLLTTGEEDLYEVIEKAKDFITIYREEFEKEEKATKSKEKYLDSNDDFVEKIYSLYPSKCPKRGSSLGKSKKDKDRIKKLLKTYTKEQIEAVVRKEIADKHGKQYMQNFSTFLNNFPDPSIMEGNEKVNAKKEDTKLVIGGVVYK